MMKVFMRKPKRKPVFTASFHQIASFHTIEGRKTERGLGRFSHDFCMPTGFLHILKSGEVRILTVESGDNWKMRMHSEMASRLFVVGEESWYGDLILPQLVF